MEFTTEELELLTTSQLIFLAEVVLGEESAREEIKIAIEELLNKSDDLDS